MDELYRGHRIRVIVELSPEADCWVPTADISWDDHGNHTHQRLTGPSGFFAIMEEAHVYAAEMARAWIDSQVKERFALSEKSSTPLPPAAEFANQPKHRKEVPRNRRKKRKSAMPDRPTLTTKAI